MTLYSETHKLFSETSNSLTGIFKRRKVIINDKYLIKHFIQSFGPINLYEGYDIVNHTTHNIYIKKVNKF